jgi:hypothetical protein
MAFPLVTVVSAPRVMIKVPWNRLKARKSVAGSRKQVLAHAENSPRRSTQAVLMRFYVATHSLYKTLSSLHFRFFKEATTDV